MSCKDIDAQVVRPDDDELVLLYQQFVPVRITDFKRVDLNRFRFDYDLTFAVLMMNAEGVTYSRFGTRDGASATSRMSIAGLKRAMRDVLRVHELQTKHASPRKDASPRTPPDLIEDHPEFQRRKAAQEACYHCHFAHELLIDELRASGKFAKP